MKYENPTCEIVLLDSVDCLIASEDVVEIKGYDTPFISYPIY